MASFLWRIQNSQMLRRVQTYQGWSTLIYWRLFSLVSNIVVLQDIVTLIFFARDLIECDWPKAVDHSQLLLVNSGTQGLCILSFKNNYRNNLFNIHNRTIHFIVLLLFALSFALKLHLILICCNSYQIDILQFYR